MPAKQKILIVDHNPDLLIVLEKYLEDSGYETTTTWNGREALSCIDSQAFAAVIIGLKSVRCLEIVRKLRQKKEDAVCIVLDSPERGTEGDELHAMVQAVISKWNLKEVVEAIRAATGSKAQFKRSASAA
jgi:DNA-binding response OmpR family regulator